MNARVQMKSDPIRASSFAPGGWLQRKCACGGGGAGLSGDCEKCSERRLQRKPAGAEKTDAIPPIVHDVLRSPGEPLDVATRAFMEPRFGHDFSQVRVHTDARAAESARAVNALAYTVGRDVVFGANKYAPATGRGRELLAHELAHTIQQRNATGAPPSAEADGVFESSAEAAGRDVSGGQNVSRALPSCGVGLSRAPDDEREAAVREAEALLARMKDEEKEEEEKEKEEAAAKTPMTLSKGPLAKPTAKPAPKPAARGDRTPSRFLPGGFPGAPGGFTDKDIYGGTDKALKRIDKQIKKEREAARKPEGAADAIRMMEEAYRKVETENPPDTKRALTLVSNVDDWLRRTATGEAYRRHFRGLIRDATMMKIGMTKAEVNGIVYSLRHGATIGGHWEFAINGLKASREELEVMGGEKKLEQTSVAGLQRTTERILKYQAAGYAAIVAGPVVIGGAVKAAPIVAHQGLMWAARNPYTAEAVGTAVVGTGLQLAEEGNIDPRQVGFDLLHIWATRGGSRGSGTSSSSAPPAPNPPSGQSNAPPPRTTIKASPPPPPSRPPARTIEASPPPPPSRPTAVNRPAVTSAAQAPPTVAEGDVVAQYGRNPASVNTQSSDWHAQVWRDNGGTGPAPIAYRIGDQVRVDMERWLSSPRPSIGVQLKPGATAQTPSKSTTRRTPDKQALGTADTGQAPAPDPLAQTPPAQTPPAPPPPPARQNRPPGSETAPASKESQQPAAPPPGRRVRMYPKDPPQGVSPDMVERLRSRAKYSVDHERHQQAWQLLGGRGDAPPAFISEGNIFLDPSRWPPKTK